MCEILELFHTDDSFANLYYPRWMVESVAIQMLAKSLPFSIQSLSEEIDKLCVTHSYIVTR